MRGVFVVAMTAVLGAACAGGEGGLPGSGEELASAVEAASAAEDVDAVLALAKWDGVQPSMRTGLERSLRSLTDRQVLSVEVESPPPDYRARRVRNGVEYSANVEVEGFLRVRFADDGENGAASIAIPFGRDEQGVRIAGTVETPLDGERGEDDVSINIVVMGGGASDAVGFSGSCVVVRSGEQVTESLSGSGNLTKAVWGTSVRDCEVRRTSEDGWLELRVSVGGDQVFESSRSEEGEPIIYEAAPR